MSNSEKQTVGLILLIYGLSDSAKIDISEWLLKCFETYRLPMKNKRTLFERDVDFTKYNKYLDEIEAYGRKGKKRFTETFFQNLCLEIAKYHMNTIKNPERANLWLELYELIIGSKKWNRSINASIYAKGMLTEALAIMKRELK